MEVIQSAISLVLTLGILVTVHEFGHFWVARRCGVRVLRFSVGFGKPLFMWKGKTGTEYALAAIPLGGYVKMLDEREGAVPEHLLHEAFGSKSVYQRIAIAAAGPLANFLFAIAAYWLMFFLGFSVVIPKVGEIIQDSPAYEAGVPVGSQITHVNGSPVYGWRDVVMGLVPHIGDTGSLSLVVDDNGVSSPYALQLDDWMRGRDSADLLPGLGVVPYRPVIAPLINTVVSDGPADISGMLKGDLVRSVDGALIEDWYALVEKVQVSAGDQLIVDVERPGVEGLVALTIIPAASGESDRGKIGVGVAPFKYPEELISTVRFGLLDSASSAIDQTWSDVSMTFGALKKMLVGLISLDNLSGPITIAQVANQSISSGTEEFLRFLALLSISLGVLNLLPIPVLDGGHILFYLIEAVRGKALSEKTQMAGFKIGVSLVLMLMAVAFYNDIMRLWSS